jgi:hypothetical protein
LGEWLIMSDSHNHHHEIWLDVALFESVNDGRALQAFVDENRIEARTYDDKVFRYFLFLRPPRIVWHVQVRKNALNYAVTLLKSKSPPVLEQALHCPACGSLRVNYPQMTRKFVLPTILLHLGILFRIIEHKCYCEDCHDMWSLPERAAGSQTGATKLSPL